MTKKLVNEDFQMMKKTIIPIAYCPLPLFLYTHVRKNPFVEGITLGKK
jgi:hypothetical protein